jgi:hypothetical protein
VLPEAAAERFAPAADAAHQVLLPCLGYTLLQLPTAKH